jgi:hypothetical protein
MAQGTAVSLHAVVSHAFISGVCTSQSAGEPRANPSGFRTTYTVDPWVVQARNRQRSVLADC